MRKQFAGKAAFFLGGFVFFLAGCVAGQQMAGPPKTLMHVFAYTPPDSATPEDFANFQKATEEMPGKIPGLRRVWAGKLREPVPAENDTIRTYAVAMEFDSLDALNAYAQNPVHVEWERVYARVRKQGTTTLDIMP